MKIHLIIATIFVSCSLFAQETEAFEVPEAPPAQPEGETVPKEDITYRFVETEAQYPGGLDSMKAYLARTIVYPKNALELGIQGKCYLSFVIGSTGEISNVKVVRGVPDCPECDKEAIRAIKSMPDWKPGQNGGVNVRSYFNLPISFTITPYEEPKKKKRRR